MGGGPNFHDDTGDGEKWRDQREIKKGQQITGLIVAVQETGNWLKGERPVVVLKTSKIGNTGRRKDVLQGTEKEKGEQVSPGT